MSAFYRLLLILISRGLLMVAVMPAASFVKAGMAD